MRADARANRERILAAAEDLFLTRGAGASTEVVAQRAGVGPGTVFRHFPTKRDLLVAVVVRHFEEITAAVGGDDRGGGADGPDDPGDRFERTFRSLVTGARPKLALLDLLAEGGDPPDEAVAASQRLRAATEARLVEAQRGGRIRADVGIDEVYALIRALAAAATMSGITPEALDAALRVTLDGLRTRPAPTGTPAPGPATSPGTEHP